MDITQYFNRKKRSVEDTETKKEVVLKRRRMMLFMKLISKMVQDEKIDMLEYTHLANFAKNGGTLVGMGRFNQILDKVVKSRFDGADKFIKLCNIMFEHLYSLFDGQNFNVKTMIDGIVKYNGGTLDFTEDQKEAIKHICYFLFEPSSKTYGLYGYAGTGKTTLITKLVNYLVLKNYVKSIVFAAPTNKAVNIMKSKFRNDISELIEAKTNMCGETGVSLNEQLDMLEDNGFKIHFLTIHNLLNYGLDMDVHGERVFVKSGKSSMSHYDLVIIDECSMIPLQIVTHIFEDIREHVRRLGTDEIVKKLPKVLFVGDPAQLPPVNEKVSMIFASSKEEFDLKLFKRCLPDSQDIKERVGYLQKDILTQKSTTLKNVVRSNDDNVVGLCNEIRGWVIGSNNTPKIGKYKGQKVFLYKYDPSIRKIHTKWFKTCLKYFKNTKQSVSNIILTWTNYQSEEYNNTLRKKIFNKRTLDDFERGDVLILNDFYNIKETEVKDKKDNSKRFYTSEQIRVTDLERVVRSSEPFSPTITVGRLDKGTIRFIEDKYRKTVNTINRKTGRKYKVWKLFVKKLTDEISVNQITETYQIYVVEQQSIDDLEKDKGYSAEQIKGLRNYLIGYLKDHANTIDRKVIKPLWHEWNKRFVGPFAKVNYAGSITTHKSQGSTYFNTFIDTHDIFKNKNSNDARRCIYTALTRTSNEVHILI